jgi:hypothetical protein
VSGGACWVCTACGRRERPPEPSPDGEGTVGYAAEDRPCTNERCKGTLKFYETEPRGPRGARPVLSLALMATALALVGGGETGLPGSPAPRARPRTDPPPPPAPPELAPGPYDRPARPIRADHVALRPGTPVRFLGNPPLGPARYDHASVRMVVDGRELSPPTPADCPDACGTSCRFHGRRNAKLARRGARAAAAAAGPAPAAAERTIDVQVPGTLGTTTFRETRR